MSQYIALGKIYPKMTLLVQFQQHFLTHLSFNQVCNLVFFCSSYWKQLLIQAILNNFILIKIGPQFLYDVSEPQRQ